MDSIQTHSYKETYLPQTSPIESPTPSTVSADSTTTNPSFFFNSVTRYLPQCNDFLKITEDRISECHTLCSLLENGDWETIIESYKENAKNLPLDGLRAFYNGIISVSQFSTLVFCWSVMNEFSDTKIHVLPLFQKDDTENIVAKKFIEKTIENIHKPFSVFIFFEKMKLQPPSEQCFFFIENTEKEDTRTITDEIAALGFNIFNKFTDQDTRYQMIPSLSMMQQFLFVYAGNTNAVTLTPVIGISTIEDIANNALTSTRDIALPFLETPLPKMVDTFFAPKALDVIMHDFYHSIIASFIPHKWRCHFHTYGSAILESKKSFKDLLILSFLDELYERSIDMEHSAFFIPKSSINAKNFLSAIKFQYTNTLNRLFIKSGKTSSEDFEETIFRLNTLIKENNVIEKIVTILLKKNFCADYACIQTALEELPNNFYERGLSMILSGP